MYRQYEDPRNLEKELEDWLKAHPDKSKWDEYDCERYYSLKDRINYAWQDDEFESDYMRENYGPDWESDLNSNNDFSSDVDGFDLDINNTVIEFARLWGQYEGGGNTTDLITVYETRELSNVLHDWAKEYLNSSDRKDLEVFFKFKMDTLFKKDNLVEREAGGQNISTSVGPFHKRGR